MNTENLTNKQKYNRAYHAKNAEKIRAQKKAYYQRKKDEAGKRKVIIMESTEIQIGEELGRFESKAQWVNTAQWVYQEAYKKIGSKDVITLDSAKPRRVVLRGLQFEEAEEDSTNPIVIYAISK